MSLALPVSLSAPAERLFAPCLLLLFGMNLITFAVFGLDKARACGGRTRIPERTLLRLSLLGGSLGALAGMCFWQHKTRHNLFRIGVPAILLSQLLAIGILLVELL